MKTFVTAALVATLTAAADSAYLSSPENNAALQSKWMLAPDFIAGFMYGMTTDNKLMEIEACYNSNHDLVPEVKFAIAAFEEGGWDPIL
jgi:hypothetical protein